MAENKKAKIALENGSVYHGYSFGAPGEEAGEVVFNTAITGYQEILTDPSYKGQIVAMTYPLIGNYGINPEDNESGQPWVEGFVVKEYSRISSNWRSCQDLDKYLSAHGILGIEGIDTRALTREIRLKGAMRAVISTVDLDDESLIAKAKASPGLEGRDLVRQVTGKRPAVFSRQGRFTVIVIDCGVKTNILRSLAGLECKVITVPYSMSPAQIMEYKPQGVFLSNGPGDPAAVAHVTATVKALIGKVPLFGICLGHQILGLALGAKTFKLKFGHHGANHPVKDLATGAIQITSQNHGFCVDPDTLDKSEIEVTHINLNDNTLEGIRHKKFSCASVQFHPESSPGPHDSFGFFREFVAAMERFHA